MEKTISVIIPVYNYGKYICEAVKSVINQSRQPDEVIIIDDCSTDGSIDILNEYLAPLNTGKIKWLIIKHAKNKGLAATRNTGITYAKSKYIMSFDSDDIMRPKCLEEHLKLADSNSIVTCGLMAFGSENYTAYPRKATIDILLKTNCIYSNSLFPKQMWNDVGGFDESEVMRYGFEDRLFWLESLFKGYKSVTSKEVCLLWRRHQNTMSSTTANPNSQKLQDYIYNKCKDLIRP